MFHFSSLSTFFLFELTLSLSLSLSAKISVFQLCPNCSISLLSLSFLMKPFSLISLTLSVNFFPFFRTLVSTVPSVHFVVCRPPWFAPLQTADFQFCYTKHEYRTMTDINKLATSDTLSFLNCNFSWFLSSDSLASARSAYHERLTPPAASRQPRQLLLSHANLYNFPLLLNHFCVGLGFFQPVWRMFGRRIHKCRRLYKWRRSFSFCLLIVVCCLLCACSCCMPFSNERPVAEQFIHV